MRIICSAYRSGAVPNENALNTSRLIQYLQIEGLKCELAVGVYKGQREIALSVTGFQTPKCMANIARAVCRLFGQESVYIEQDHIGSLLFSDGTMQELGPQVTVPHSMAPAFVTGVDGYTFFLNGMAIAAIPHEMAKAA